MKKLLLPVAALLLTACSNTGTATYTRSTSTTSAVCPEAHRTADALMIEAGPKPTNDAFDQDRERAWLSNVRAGFRVITSHPECFDMKTVALAQEVVNAAP